MHYGLSRLRSQVNGTSRSDPRPSRGSVDPGAGAGSSIAREEGAGGAGVDQEAQTSLRISPTP